ncbi:amidohydrolase family protein [Nocardioides agariphilus]|uniref:Amidohydrolase family protein n=1 Tax=Nocardioides agariphilus TaxID=433664 RepID=A0A930VNG2_9ACTN|nr:amidohydrolase family protein [Nocardioides agariphilus]MBF4767050.1 amidohydrolase family protein [Nocardioides agariphilus]
MQAIRAPAAFDGERFLEGGATVLVDGERIVGVEPFGFDVPHGTEETSYDGTLLPGLIDTHVHLVADGTPGGLEAAGALGDDEVTTVVRRTLAQQAASGTTTVRDLGDARYLTLGFRDAASPGVPRIVASGPPFTIRDGHCHYLGGVAEGPADIRDAMAEHVERGVDVVKVMASGGMLTPGSDQLGVQFTAEDLRLIVDLAHEAGLPVHAHAHSLRGAWHALAAQVDGIEHFSCLTDTGMQTPPELLAAVAAAGTVVCPTIGWDRSMIDPDRMPPALRLLTERMGLDPDSMVSARAEQARQLRAHGVTIVSGLDAGVSPPKAHGNLWRSVLELVHAGFPVEEALATATSVAADVCRLSEVTGRLRAGLAADLLVVSGDLRSEPTLLAEPVHVVIRGVPCSPPVP